MIWDLETEEEWRQFDAAHPDHRLAWWTGRLLARWLMSGLVAAHPRVPVPARARPGAGRASRVRPVPAVGLAERHAGGRRGE